MTPDESLTPYASQRRQIHDTLTATVTDTDPGHVISGWVLIFETCGPDGERAMHTASGDAVGDTDLPPWTAEGWTRYVAASGFFDPSSPVEPDDE